MFIEDVVDSTKSPPPPPPPPPQDHESNMDTVSLSKNLPRRLLDRQRVSAEVDPVEGSASPGIRRASFSIGTRATPNSEVPSLASQTESWRAKGNPLPSLPEKHTQTRSSHPARVPQQQQSEPPLAPATLVGAPLALDHVADIVEGSMTDLQVVDFSDMGNLVGGGDEKEGEKGSETEKKRLDSTQQEAQGVSSANKIRPTASDFYDDMPSTIVSPTQAENNVWKRRMSTSVAVQADERDKDKKMIAKEEQTSSNTLIVSAAGLPHPRSRPHVEASMSALNDVMSRIKGALDGMQASGTTGKENRPHAGISETEQHHHHPTSRTFYPQPLSSSSLITKNVSHRERWQPAPLTQSLQQQTNEEQLEALRESLSTSTDPLCTPPPPDTSSSSVLPVHLPKISHKIEPVSQKQQYAFSQAPYPPRYDCLSFDPPVLGMKRREFTVDSVLFKPYQGSHFKSNRIRVSLPAGAKKTGPHVGPRTVSLAPKYGGNGNGGVGGAGGFGKGCNADGAISWRKGGAIPAVVVANTEEEKKKKKKDFVSAEKQKNEGESVSDVNVKKGLMEKQVQGEFVTSSQVITRTTRPQPKMPAGSVVAFIRDSRIDVVEADPKPLVNFIVTSELDEPIVEAFSGDSVELEKGKKGSVIKDENVGVSGMPSNLVVTSSPTSGTKTGTETSSSTTTSSPPPSASAVNQLQAPETKSVEASVSIACSGMKAVIEHFPFTDYNR